jgi:hypothetical protein
MSFIGLSHTPLLSLGARKIKLLSINYQIYAVLKYCLEKDLFIFKNNEKKSIESYFSASKNKNIVHCWTKWYGIDAERATLVKI